MLAIAFTDYRKLPTWAPAFYLFGLILLVVVRARHRVEDQRSAAWIKVPGIGQFQPSEFVKVTTAMMLARYFGKNRTQALSVKEMIVGGLILALPCGLILLEPDVGSVLTYVPILAAVLFLSAVRLRLVFAAVALAVVMIPVAYWAGVKTNLIKNYQQERINVILDPENADRRRIGYHTWQSILTVGEGGLFGSRSSAEHSQSGLKFLPEPHTDFIYAVTAENYGFIGCVLVLLAYAILLSRLITGARRSSTVRECYSSWRWWVALPFKSLSMWNGVGHFASHWCTLPLMSAGLASLIATFIAIGVAISVQLRRFVN